MTLRIGSLCTGYGGLDMAARTVLGGEVAWHADNDPGAAAILAHHHPGIPNLGDLTAVDWQQVEPVDVVTAGYPCQPFSTAGLRKGTADDRHIWPYIAAALGVLQPRYAIFENVAGHLRLGFDTVLADLARLGFDAEWLCVEAQEVGAPHKRRRLIVLARPADTAGAGCEGADPVRGRLAGDRAASADASHLGHEWDGDARGRRPGPADGGVSATDTASDGRQQGRPEPAGLQGRPDAAVGGGPTPADTEGNQQREPADRGTVRPEPWDGASIRWGHYGPAVTRWAAVLGRPAPRPTDDRGRLNPAFVEWLMGLPAGHVTDIPGLTRTAQLKALGNGVVPQQAAAALRLLLARVHADRAEAA